MYVLPGLPASLRCRPPFRHFCACPGRARQRLSGVGCLWWAEQQHVGEGFADVGEVVVDAPIDGDDCAGTNLMILAPTVRTPRPLCTTYTSSASCGCWLSWPPTGR